MFNIPSQNPLLPLSPLPDPPAPTPKSHICSTLSGRPHPPGTSGPVSSTVSLKLLEHTYGCWPTSLQLEIQDGVAYCDSRKKVSCSTHAMIGCAFFSSLFFFSFQKTKTRKTVPFFGMLRWCERLRTPSDSVFKGYIALGLVLDWSVPCCQRIFVEECCSDLFITYLRDCPCTRSASICRY